MDRVKAQEIKTLYLKASESNTSSTEPTGVSIRKRKTGADGDSPRKRQRVSESASRGTGCRKRKASQDAEETRKRKRTSQPQPSEDSVKGKETMETLKKDATSSSVKAATSTEKRQKNNAASTSREFAAKYEQLNLLGEGGHGSVYAGYRRADHFPVAIKYIPRDNIICKSVSHSKRTLPVEVAVMTKMAKRAGGSVGKSAAISLLDYYDLDQGLILVLERPVPAVDLLRYIQVKGGSLQEEEARLIVKQLVEAARELQSQNIFHRDIKLENILIETSSDVPRLRLIDFGLSCFTKKTSFYRTFYGTSAHIPPEWYQCWTYRTGPTTVWQLGVVLYEILHGLSFETTMFLNNRLPINEQLSQSCQDVLRLCLAADPQQRPSLEQLQLHPWLM